MQNDPINFVDPSGLNMSSGFCGAEYSYGQCGGDAGFWGSAGGWFGGGFAEYDRLFGGMPASVVQQAAQYQLQREVDDFFRRLPPEAYYIGHKSWAYWFYKGDTLRAEIISFSVSRGLDAFFNGIKAGFIIGILSRTLMVKPRSSHRETRLPLAGAVALVEVGMMTYVYIDSAEGTSPLKSLGEMQRMLKGRSASTGFLLRATRRNTLRLQH